MTPTKKQISEVTIEANKNNFNVEKALITLKNCSLSMYKVIGAKGVVESSIKTSETQEARNNGGIALSHCTILSMTEKAILVVLPTLKHTEKWIAKSIIVNDLIPAWATK